MHIDVLAISSQAINSSSSCGSCRVARLYVALMFSLLQKFITCDDDATLCRVWPSQVLSSVAGKQVDERGKKRDRKWKLQFNFEWQSKMLFFLLYFFSAFSNI